MSIKGKVKNEFTIEFCIDFKEPIEVHEFTKSLNAFSNEYKKFIQEEYGSEHPVDAKLHIEKIQEGSVLTTFAEYAIYGVPFLGNINTVMDFGNHLKALYSVFSGRTDIEVLPKYDSKDLSNIADIIAPGTNIGNHTTIEVKGDNNNVQVVILDADDKDANAITNRINKAKKEIKDPKSNKFTKELFYFEQAKKDINSKVGNYGVIESITHEKLRVIFEDDKKDKKAMLKGNINPLKCMFIVDVEVKTVKDEPKVYKILKLHEIIGDDEQE